MGLKRGIRVSVTYRVGRVDDKKSFNRYVTVPTWDRSTGWFPHLKVILKDLVWV